MKVREVSVTNFRCLESLRLELDDITVLVGANGSGKSTVLHALRWFFRGGALSQSDLTGHDESLASSVSVTFSEFDATDRDVLGRYAVGDVATFQRTWSDQEEKLTGRLLAFAEFEQIRAQGGAVPKREAYAALRSARPDMRLPSAASGAAVDRSMDEWEAAHPEDLQPATTSATHMFGVVGTARLGGRFDYVLVPAVTDIEREFTDARGTLLRQLMERTGGDTNVLSQELRNLASEVRRRVDKIVAGRSAAALKRVAAGVTAELQRFVPNARVVLHHDPSALELGTPGVSLRVSESGLETDLAHQGHGFSGPF
jgi:hypothetical protein